MAKPIRIKKLLGMHVLLCASLCLAYSYAVRAERRARIVSPAELLSPFDEAKLDRRGWIFNKEPIEEWKKRLRASPFSIERAFAIWDPSAGRHNDTSVLVCFTRKLREHEQHEVVGAQGNAVQPVLTLTYRDGTEQKKTYYDLTNSFLRSDGALDGRCFEYTELWHHKSIRYSSHYILNVERERRFRPDQLLRISFGRNYKTRYRGIRFKSYGTAPITPLIASARTVCKKRSHSDCELSKVSITEDYIRGRMEGEAARYSRGCNNLALIRNYEPPAEDDQSEYAAGFSKGWLSAEQYLGGEEKVCANVLSFFDLPVSGVGRLLRAAK